MLFWSFQKVHGIQIYGTFWYLVRTFQKFDLNCLLENPKFQIQKNVSYRKRALKFFVIEISFFWYFVISKQKYDFWLPQYAKNLSFYLKKPKFLRNTIYLANFINFFTYFTMNIIMEIIRPMTKITKCFFSPMLCGVLYWSPCIFWVSLYQVTQPEQNSHSRTWKLGHCLKLLSSPA